jgi:hypothetical protein
VLAALVAGSADSHANLDLIFGAHRRVLGRAVQVDGIKTRVERRLLSAYHTHMVSSLETLIL